MLLGNFDDVGKEAAEVAINFVSINIHSLRPWLHTGARPPIDAPLQNRVTDVKLAVGNLDVQKQGSSAGACQVRWLGNRPCDHCPSVCAAF
jgi:hypothetical protein